MTTLLVSLADLAALLLVVWTYERRLERARARITFDAERACCVRLQAWIALNDLALSDVQRDAVMSASCAMVPHLGAMFLEQAVRSSEGRVT